MCVCACVRACVPEGGIDDAIMQINKQNIRHFDKRDRILKKRKKIVIIVHVMIMTMTTMIMTMMVMMLLRECTEA